MDGQRVSRPREKKSVWDSCTTDHPSMTGELLVAMNCICREDNITRSKLYQEMAYAYPRISDMLDKLRDSGLFDDNDSRYESFKKKQNLLKK